MPCTSAGVGKMLLWRDKIGQLEVAGEIPHETNGLSVLAFVLLWCCGAVVLRD